MGQWGRKQTADSWIDRQLEEAGVEGEEENT